MSAKFSKLNKILIINPFGIGDVLFTTPLMRSIKSQHPDCRLFFMGNTRTVEFLKNFSYLEKIFVYDRDEFVAVYKKSRWQFLLKWKKFLNELKKEKFDVVLDLSLSGATDFFMWAIGVRQRIGYNYKKRSPFLTVKIPLKAYERKHIADYYLDLLPFLELEIRKIPMEFPLTIPDQQNADQKLFQAGILPSDPLIGIVPGGGASWGKDAVLKRWAPENYAKLADKLIENYSAKLILMGDPREKELCRRVTAMMRHPNIDLSGQTTIGEMAAILKRCKVNVLNDGGPLHVGVAVGAKTVSIFGPVDDEVYGPYDLINHRTVKKDIPCRPCYRRFRMSDCQHISCLNQLDVEDVLRKVEEIL